MNTYKNLILANADDTVETIKSIITEYVRQRGYEIETIEYEPLFIPSYDEDDEDGEESYEILHSFDYTVKGVQGFIHRITKEELPFTFSFEHRHVQYDFNKGVMVNFFDLTGVRPWGEEGNEDEMLSKISKELYNRLQQINFC